ncbi:hypothetical protein KSP40_PGU015830 [Platanthera guangdongensis]|uniref:Uncharacterized protein n=1 Tax=Platanthera guangdongensis TaxID=2320717 RepID=A0ABR2MTT0_9ASPA
MFAQTMITRDQIERPRSGKVRCLFFHVADRVATCIYFTLEAADPDLSESGSLHLVFHREPDLNYPVTFSIPSHILAFALGECGMPHSPTACQDPWAGASLLLHSPLFCCTTPRRADGAAKILMPRKRR